VNESLNCRSSAKRKKNIAVFSKSMRKPREKESKRKKQRKLK
jgi:hypothetical protein